MAQWLGRRISDQGACIGEFSGTMYVTPKSMSSFKPKKYLSYFNQTIQSSSLFINLTPLWMSSFT